MDLLSERGGHWTNDDHAHIAPAQQFAGRNRSEVPTRNASNPGLCAGNLIEPACEGAKPQGSPPVQAEAHSRSASHTRRGLGSPSRESGAADHLKDDALPNLVGSIQPGSAGAEVHFPLVDRSPYDLGVLIALWRQRQDLKRAYQRLDLQCQSVIRRYSGGDREIAAKRWTAIQKGDDDEVAPILEPYRMAMAPLDGAAHALELQLCRIVRKLPIWTGWGKSVRGLGELSLAGLIGEAGRGFGEYRSVSALWKRMGLAVFDGQRQRRVADAEAALIHGYAPQRRAYAFVLSTSLMRAQKQADPDAGSEADPYRAIYDARKAYELAREIPKAHAHNRALRVMVKALLKDAWAADRAINRLGA